MFSSPGEPPGPTQVLEISPVSNNHLSPRDFSGRTLPLSWINPRLDVPPKPSPPKLTLKASAIRSSSRTTPIISTAMKRMAGGEEGSSLSDNFVACTRDPTRLLVIVILLLVGAFSGIDEGPRGEWGGPLAHFWTLGSFYYPTETNDTCVHDRALLAANTAQWGTDWCCPRCLAQLY